MARLVKLKDKYRVAFANDPDSDRHGIVTPSAGLMNPNHYLAVLSVTCSRTAPFGAGHFRRKTLVRQQHDHKVVQKSAADCEVPWDSSLFRIGRRFMLFRARKCRGELPAPRRTGLATDKDGPIMTCWPPRSLPYDKTRRALSRTDRGVLHTITAHRCAGNAEQKAKLLRTCRPKAVKASTLLVSQLSPS